jgi:hypothetical protein
MATDKKSQHVGNHGGTYTDVDGMTKQFTMIDHDTKTTIASGISDKVDKDWQKKYKASLIQRITDLPASLCPEPFADYTVRGDTKIITWNIDMLIDNGNPVNRLRDLCVMLENKAELIKLIH